MNLIKSIVGLTLAFSAVAVGCSVTAGEESGSSEQAIAKEPIDRGDPPPKCIPSCVDKACGAKDGCGDRCSSGSCPAGTTCGGGGVPNSCACKPSCNDQKCGASDGCGGICTTGACSEGEWCSGVTPGVCSPVPMNQGVECFVFNDGYTFMAGPSDAIYFGASGEACVPDGTTTGACRRWFGRCRTTDPSHTPVTFQAGDPLQGGGFSWNASTDALRSFHFRNSIFAGADDAMSCAPDGKCASLFGNGELAGGRPVRCRIFGDGYSRISPLTAVMGDTGSSTVMGVGLGLPQKWFGRCEVGGCGDGLCDANESHASCPADCTCGDGVCGFGERFVNCPSDCHCGDGTCNYGEWAGSCPDDCN